MVIGGDNLRVQNVRIVGSPARDDVLDDGFLFLQQPAGVDQVLADGKNLRVGARQLDLRLRAFVHLRLGVGVQSLGGRSVSSFTLTSSYKATRSV